MTLQYKVYNKQPRKMFERSVSLTTNKKSGLDEALEDVANGRVTTIHIPSSYFGRLQNSHLGMSYQTKLVIIMAAKRRRTSIGFS